MRAASEARWLIDPKDFLSDGDVTTTRKLFASRLVRAAESDDESPYVAVLQAEIDVSNRSTRWTACKGATVASEFEKLDVRLCWAAGEELVRVTRH